jgi:hypothetical protein
VQLFSEHKDNAPVVTLGGERRPYLLIEIGVLPPQSDNDLFNEVVAEIVVVGAADRPSNMAPLFGLGLSIRSPLKG